MTNQTPSTTKTKKYLFMTTQSLWDELRAFQEKHNADPNNVGHATCNNLIETAIKQFLLEN